MQIQSDIGAGTSQPQFQIQMAFQPIWDCRLNEVFAYEALARGPNGEEAEDMIEKLRPEERSAFDHACRLAAMRDAVNAGFLRSTTLLSINFFPEESDDPFEDAERTIAAARELGLPHERLMFEFGAGEDLDPHRLAETFEAHRKYKMHTAFEDFGSHSGSLLLLSRCTPDAIKLHPHLCHGLTRSWSRRLAVEKVISVARMRNIRLIAQGVETRDDFLKLLSLGVRYFQGYYIARPQIGRFERPRFGRAA